jgi:hypothetical protein
MKQNLAHGLKIFATAESMEQPKRYPREVFETEEKTKAKSLTL